MNFRCFTDRYLALCNLIILNLVSGCIFQKASEQKTMITGNELNMYLHTDTFEEYEYEHLFMPNYYFLKGMNGFRNFGFINLLLIIPKNKDINDPYVVQRKDKIFNNAILHLREHFIDETYDLDTVRKILICCIEYSIRLGNEKYLNLNDHVNCKRILGIGTEKLDFSYGATAFHKNGILPIVIL